MGWRANPVVFWRGEGDGRGDTGGGGAIPGAWKSVGMTKVAL